MARLSVVIPLYQKAPTIRRCLSSVLSQSGAGLDVIVVDDGSTDGGDRIVESDYGDVVRLIRQDRRGAASARNRGIERARASAVAFLDADDYWEPGFVENISRLRARFPRAGIWATAYRKTHDGQVRLSALPGDAGGYIRDFFQDMLWCRPLSCSSVAVRKDVFARVGTYPEDDRLAEDWDMWCRAALEFPIAYSARPLAVVDTTAPGRVSRQRRFDGRYTRLYGTLVSALEREDHKYTTRRSIEMFLAQYLLKMARHCQQDGRSSRATRLRDEARRYL